MKNSGGWLTRPIADICVCIALLVISVFIIASVSNRYSIEDSDVWSIIIKHYGIDAKEIEKTIAIPLEDFIYSIEGVKNVVTVSENGSGRAFITFNKKKSLFIKNKTASRYEEIREIAQRVYENLPASAQRPQIVSASESRTPVWTAAVFYTINRTDLDTYLEKTVKPAFLALDGAADVEISGIGVKEIVISLTDKALGYRISALELAKTLSANDAVIPAGYIKENDREINIIVDGRYNEISDIEKAFVGLNDQKYTSILDIAKIKEHERMPDTLARLNGKTAVLISIIPVEGVSTEKLSLAIKKELHKIEIKGVEWTVLFDKGAEDGASFRSVCFAALQGAAAVALLSFLVMRKKKNCGFSGVLVLSLAIPFICVLSAAFILVLGAPLSKIALAGISCALGAAIDACLLCAEQAPSFRQKNGGFSLPAVQKSVSKLRVELICGSATTIAALFPLAGLSFTNADINAVACAVGAVTLISLITALFFLPPVFICGLRRSFCIENKFAAPKKDGYCFNVFLYTWFIKIKNYIKYFSCRILKLFLRLFGRLIWASYHYPLCVILISFLITIAGFVTLIFSGTDTGFDSYSNSIYAQIEFEGDLLAEKIDEILSRWAVKLKETPGIENIQTGSKTGSASVLVAFNPALINASVLREIMRANSPDGGFVYINDATRTDRNWTIRITGDDSEKCRDYAKKFAQITPAIPLVKETVLNFKEGPKKIVFKPKRAVIAGLDAGKNQMSYSAVADDIRRAVYGPVAYKRLGSKKEKDNFNSNISQNEIDVRIKGLEEMIPRKKSVEEMFVYSGENEAQTAKLSTVMEKEEENNISTIRRYNRKREASISIRTKPMDARKARDIVTPYFDKVYLPPGYYAEFDGEAVEQADSLSGTIFYFLLALIFCYMIIAAVNESFVVPLIVLSVVPPSAACAAFVLTIFQFKLNAAAACAFIVVCGMAVNTAVICISELYDKKKKYNNERCENSPNEFLGFYSIYNAIRKRLSVLTVTTLTTVVSAFPFVLLNENTNMIIKMLALITIIGISASYIFSVSLVPAIVIKLDLFANKAGCRPSLCKTPGVLRLKTEVD
ncbi:MAG: efflux RND transporter permease subunit [Spirochaetaceae bacterium]|jgi:multidrug efflux pump subunit AcrB|nr:efflux RND transporter permease subunit [Spirochaetaceae bacterium]